MEIQSNMFINIDESDIMNNSFRLYKSIRASVTKHNDKMNNMHQ